VREGHEAELWIDTRSMHIFDPDSGQSLTAGAEPVAAASAAP
jgi:multiple sugar transport system ATP-binding protein